MARDDVRPARTTGTVLVMFFLIAYAVTWLLQAPVALSEDGIGWLPFTPSDGPLYFLLIAASTFGPTVAALVMLRTTGGPGAVRELLRRCVRWRVPVRWYLVAVPAVLAVPTIAAFAIPGTAEHFAVSVEHVVTMVILLVTVQLFVGALGEEPGWRGFALPRLQQRYGPLGASLLLGVLWAGWHAPLFLVGDWVDGKGGTTVWTATQYLLLAMALAVLMTWVYNQARASVLLMILFHAAVNTSLGGVVMMFEGSDVADHRHLLPGMIGFGVAAFAVVAATRGRLGHESSAAGDALANA